MYVYPISPPYLSPRAMVLFLNDIPMFSGYNNEKLHLQIHRKNPGYNPPKLNEYKPSKIEGRWHWIYHSIGVEINYHRI